ncbi:MAG TPA: RNA methyltransferase, partial [Abditibacteriaceae bacterium]|nr:RNA methyltransferase [Abditibacteriaceae bacterium]
HPLCKLVRALHAAKGRREHKLFMVEGSHAVLAAIEARWPLQHLLATPDDIVAQWQNLERAGDIEVQPVSAELLEYLSDAGTSPGVIAIAALPAAPVVDWSTQSLALVLDGINDPGNVGTLLRAADATGVGVVALTAGSADAFGPKAVRASAGSLFHLPLLQHEKLAPQNLIKLLNDQSISIVAAAAHDGTSCYEYSWPRRCALVLGHETRGVSPEFEEAATARVTIPIYGKAESLNVAAAGAVLLYAWRLQQS